MQARKDPDTLSSNGALRILNHAAVNGMALILANYVSLAMMQHIWQLQHVAYVLGSSLQWGKLYSCLSAALSRATSQEQLV